MSAAVTFGEIMLRLEALMDGDARGVCHGEGVR